MNTEKSLILNSKQITQKLVRIAHEIHENHYKEKEIIIVGITGRGSEMAERLGDLLKKISDGQISVEHIELNKEKPLSGPISFTGELKAIKNKCVVLVDDVLNSGRTLIYASRHILDAEPKHLAIATLVDRFHRKFPIRADYVGLTLSTNLKEHVTVDLAKGKEAVYLE
jgi:pyrimidine operon attenuation protein / uracil phosphoribosyltransferase